MSWRPREHDLRVLSFSTVISHSYFVKAKCRGQRLLLPSISITLVADLLTFYLQRMSLPLFALLQPYISIVISGELVQGHFFVTLIRPPSLFTNSMSHFSSAYLTVVWTVVGTRLIAFALAARAMPLKKAILTRKFVLLHGRWKSDAFKVYLRSEVLHAN